MLPPPSALTSSRRRSSVASRAGLALPVLILAATALASGCRRSKGSDPAAAQAPAPAPIPALGEISVVDATPDDARPAGGALKVEPLVQQVRATLSGAGLFAATKPDAGAAVAARVRIEISCEDVVAGAKAAARAAVRLRIDTRPSEIAAGHWNEDVQAGAETIYKPASKPDRADLFQRLVARTVGDLLSGYLARQRLWTGSEAAARATLKADAGEMRLEAVHVVAERKLASAAPELLQLLDDPDEATRDAALGALVELRDRRAVGVLASQKSMRDRREMRKILDAISVLGGSEAAEYLAFVADGHDDPEIRTMAAEARARLLRRADAAAAK
jgi:hypothetical protein